MFVLAFIAAVSADVSHLANHDLPSSSEGPLNHDAAADNFDHGGDNGDNAEVVEINSAHKPTTESAPLKPSENLPTTTATPPSSSSTPAPAFPTFPGFPASFSLGVSTKKIRTNFFFGFVFVYLSCLISFDLRGHTERF